MKFCEQGANVGRQYFHQVVECRVNGENGGREQEGRVRGRCDHPGVRSHRCGQGSGNAVEKKEQNEMRILGS